MRLNLLGRRPRAGNPDLARVKAMARAHLGLGEDDTVTVSEIDCTDPACPGAETVVLVLRAGRPTRAAKLAMPAAEVGDEALAAALDALLP